MDMKQSWRDSLKIHPAADLFPLMGPDELKEIGKDIEKNGLKRHISQIVLWCKGECPSHRGRLDPRRVKWEDVELLDGRNRLDALEAVGLKIKLRDQGHGLFLDVSNTLVADEDEFDDLDGSIYLKKGEEYENELFEIEPAILFEIDHRGEEQDPYSYAISANILRRHLTTAKKGELIEALLKANPERSDRATAAIAKVSDKTVAAKRETLEQGAEIPHHETRVGKDGVAQPAEKPKPIITPTRPNYGAVARIDRQYLKEQGIAIPGAKTAPIPPVASTSTEELPSAGKFPPPPTAPAEHIEPPREEARNPVKPAEQTGTKPPQPVTLPEPEGEPLPAEMTKWVATFRSWTKDHKEIALGLIGVDEDSIADLKERDDLLELKELHIIALKEDNSRLWERLASQLEPKPEPDDDAVKEINPMSGTLH
jgi:hypothetical protein